MGSTPATNSASLAEQISRWISPDSLLAQPGYLGVEAWRWLMLLALLTIALVVERIAAALLRRIAQRIAGFGEIKLREAQLKRFVRPLGMLFGWSTFMLCYPLLEIAEGNPLSRTVGIVGGAIVSVAGGIAAWRFIDVIGDYLRAKALQTENKFDDMLVPLVRRMLKIFVVLIGIAYLLSTVTEDFYRVIAGLSIGSAVLMFAFKDSLENVFGTFTVLIDKPFQLGDWITVDGADGTVERVGFRSTRIRTFYNSLVSIPNRHFISARVDNWGSRQYRRLRMTLGVTYDTPPEKIEAFCEGIRELLRQHPYTRKDYYHVYLNGFGASSLDILLYCFLETPDWAMELRERHRLLADILRLAEQLSVQFAFPSTSVYVTDEASLTHPNRPKNDRAGAQLGRQLGKRVAKASLKPFGPNKPGPVKFVHSGSPVAAPGDEGDG